jgi:hypothetical protein
MTAKIINFRTKASKKIDLSMLSPGASGFNVRIFEDVLKNALGTGIEMDPLLQIRIHLSSLRGYISSDSVAISRRTFREYSYNDLLLFAEKSTPNQWSAKPGLFQALIDEIDSRD